MRKKHYVVNKLYLLLVFAFLYLPILVLIVYSFNSSKSFSLFTGFSFEWYVRLFQNRSIMAALGATLIIAVVASVVSTILGTAAAIGIHAMGKQVRAVVVNITYLPILNPEIVTGVSLMLLFSVMKFISSGMVRLILAHIMFCVPYVVLNVMPKLRQMDPNLNDAALDLGCDPRQAFVKVVVPQILPGIISGFLMAFTYSIDDFIVSYFVAGPDVQTLPIYIYSMLKVRVSPEINALSAIIFVIVLAALVLMNLRDLKPGKKAARAKRRRAEA